MKTSLIGALFCLCLGLPLALGCDALSSDGAKSEASDDDDDDDNDNDKKKKKKKNKKKKSKKKGKSDKDGDADNKAAKRSLDDEDPFVAKHLKLLLTAAQCDSKQDRMEHWCRIAEGFPNGKSGVPSKGVKVGTTTFVVTADASKATLDKFATLSCLAVRKDGKTFAGITTVTPDNADERRSVDETRLDVIGIFSGDRKEIRMAPSLKNYVDSLSGKAKYPTSKTDGGFRIEGGSNADVRRVGATWLAVEVPRNKPAGIYVSIFTDAGYR